MDVLAGTFNNVYVYGGYSGTGSATGNTATISGGTVSKVYGGNSKGGNVTSNNVVITGGAVGNAWGGYFYSSKAETKNTVTNNTVTISGGTVERVYGGESANGDVEANTVAITGGTVQGYASLVYGGSSTYGAAKNNQVNISAGTVNTTFGVKGGRSQYGDATGNTVTISGGTITGKVVGGASNNTATDNKVILAKGAAAANLNNATLYGSTRSNGDSLPTTHDGNTLTVGGEKNITVATVKNFDVYDFKLGDVENGDVILNLLNDTDLGKVDVKVEDTSAITGKRKIYLMKLANGKTLAFTAGDGTTTYADDVSQNAKKTATLTKTRKVEQEDNNLLLVDNIAYDFGLTPDTMKNGYIFITPADTGNTGATTIDATDVTLNKAGIDGRFLSLSKGDKVYLLKNTADGTLTYTGTNGENQTLNHTYTNDAKDATVTTTGEVAADGNDLVLKIDGVKYNFILAPTTTDKYTFLTSTNTGETKIDAADVTLDESKLANQMLSLNKGDTVYLLKNDTTGTLTYTGTNGDGQKLDHTYTNDTNDATVKTTGEVAADGNDLVLKIDGVKYNFILAPTTADGDTFLTSENTGKTKIDRADMTLNDEALDGKVLALSKGDKVYLLKNDTTTGTLEYTGNDTDDRRTYTYNNTAGDASIVTKATVRADDNDLVLNVDGVTYTYKLTVATKNGDTFITSPHADDTKIDGADVKLDLDATNSDVLSLSKGDKVYLLKKSNGTLAYTETGDAPALKHTYTNDDGTATIETTGTVQSDGKSLVLNVDGVTYTYKLAAAMKDGDTFITSPNADDTRIDGADVKLDDTALAGNILSLNKGDKVYLLKKDNGTLAYTGTNELTHTYTNETGDATIATTATVGSDGKSLVLNVDDVKYIFTLSSATKTDGTPMLMLTNAADTKIDASDVVLADSAEPLSLQKGDTVTLLTKDSTAGALTFADMAGKAQRTSVYTKTGTAGSAAITTTGTLAQDGKSLVMKVDGVKYTFALAPAAKADDTLLELEYTGDTTISKGDVTVKTSGVLRNLDKGDKVYLLKKTNGKLIATDITDTVNLPTIYGTITGTVAEDDSNNLVLNVTKEESLTDNLKDKDNPYKYIVIVEDDTKNTGNGVMVGAGENADKGAIAALAKDETDATELKDNTLTVQGKVKGRAVSANSVAGNATENNVTIGVGATVDGFVAGGLTADGTANGNTVTINGGTITGDVYGGYSEKEANDNIVNLAGGTIKGTVYGGYVPDASAATSVRSKRSMPRRTLAATASSTSGNTLNVTKATTVGNLAKFDTYNFYLPAGTSNGATMLHLMDNADTDMTNSTVNVKASGALNLYNNENVYLIKKEGGSLLTDGMTTNVGEANVLIGVTAELTCAVENKDNNLVLNVTKGPEKPSSSSSSGGSSSSSSSSGSGSSGSSSESSNTSSTENANSASSSGNASSSGSSSSASTPRVTINPDTKSAVETRAAQSNVVNMGSDYFVDTTLPQIAGLAYGADGFGAFGGSSGSAHMRYKTGSHVDSRGTAFNAGIAKKNANKSGTFTWGPFFETGHGNYDSYLDNGTHGSGSTSYTGGGVFARQEFAGGLYVEGSLRTGKTKADYSSSDLGTSYSTDAPYFGAHLGVGRVLPMHGGSLDIYGRYLYSRTGSDSAHLATGETYDFDAVDSHRLMLGTRYTREANQLSKWYAGAALLYEFGGEARAHFQGYSLASPSSAGASVMI